jgi:hypothetical protein
MGSIDGRQVHALRQCGSRYFGARLHRAGAALHSAGTILHDRHRTTEPINHPAPGASNTARQTENQFRQLTSHM